MRRFKRVLAVVALLTIPVMATGDASAASTCQAGYTGPDSNNLCRAVTRYTCTVVNSNTVQVDNTNTQISVSGNAGAGGNTGAGGASSGSATNSNGVTFTASVSNNNVCTVVATVPASTTPSTPAGGKGRITAPAKSVPKSLAVTSGDDTASLLLTIFGASLVGAAGLRLVSWHFARKR